MNPRVVKTEAAVERLPRPPALAADGGGPETRPPAALIELSSSDSDSDGEGGGGGSAKRSRGAGGDGAVGKRARVSAAAAAVDVPPGFLDPLPLPPPPPPATCATKQFWKAGDYDGKSLGDGAPQPSVSGLEHVRVHPKFLHSNATSHKWALGALAELLDNSLDEVINGATYVNIDMLENNKDKTRMLLVEDDGGGMDPDKMRQCMSLGYSAKSKVASTIGQYGNGFKTSTMRLGADVLVFSRSRGKEGKRPTQSIGMLSYTFLRSTSKEDIVVPMIDYENEQGWKRKLRTTLADWNTSLQTIVTWSPYSTEAELLEQFSSIKEQGTRIIIYNLWEDDQGDLELDFDADVHDIQIRGGNRDEKNIQMAKQFPNSKHFLTYRHSLRSYASILYLRVPNLFQMILRGKEIEHHNIVTDMMLKKEVTYRPVGPNGLPKDSNMVAVVTIGFVKDAKHHIDVQGFNVYHKNRLIKPFWRVWTAAGSGGRGVIGVLEANFIEPAHDKQDFERTTLLARLEARLVHMQKDYWSGNAHRIGYVGARVGRNSETGGEMADPNDNMDDAMMDIINNDALQGAQFEGDDNNQEVDDGSQYFADYEDEQDNAGEPSGSTTTTGKSRNVRGPKKPLEGRFILSEFEEDTGKVLGPHAQKFVSHCGYLVRDRIPINAREWKQKKVAPHISFVSDRDKALVWQDVLQHFALDTEDEALKERVRNWAMKKMATQFQCWKKKLYNTFISKNLTPDFNTKAYVKLRPFWDEFVQFKTSEEGEARVRRNQQNARQKQYHHHLGSGGYRSAIPKWERMEREILAKGIEPESINWPERAKYWFFGHGGSLDLETGKIVYGAKLQRAAKRFAYARGLAESGRWQPNRDKDELTYALESTEHGGRTRGYGEVSWEHAFPKDKATYRSRQRKKYEEAERMRRMEEMVLESREVAREAVEREKALEAKMNEEIKRQVQIAVSSIQRKTASEPGVNISPPNQLKSSCASTEVPVIQDDAGLRFPVDDITDPLTTCELHIPEGNATVMVAIGVVSRIDPTKTPRCHGALIPPGYASVSVDRVVKGNSNVPLDIEGGDGEKTLGEAEKTFICWRKRYIIIPRASPPPPQQPNPSRTSPNLSPIIHSPPGHSVAGDDNEVEDTAASPPAPSPPRRAPTPTPAAPSPPRRAPTPPLAPSPPRRAPTPPPAAPSPPRRAPTPTPAAPSPPRRAPTPPPAPSPPRRAPTPTPAGPLPKKRRTPQTKASAPPPPKKKALGRTPAISKTTKLSYEKTAEEIDASVKTDVDSFFAKVKAKSEAKRNPEKPYFFVRPEVLRQRVDAHQKKLRHARKDSPLSDYDRTLTKSIEEAKKKEKRARKGVAQLGEQSQQSVPPLVIGNEYGSNTNVLEQISENVHLDQLDEFFAETGLSISQMLGGAHIKSAPEVDHWKKEYVYGKSLYNPEKLMELRTQMYLLNKWYMAACRRKADDYICVKIRNHHYFRGDDIIMVQFNELHQLCHMNALDKSLISCFCLDMMRDLTRRNDKNIGFVDPYIVFKDPNTPYDQWRPQTERNFRMFLINQKNKRFILFPYNFGFHWILIVFDLSDGHLLIYDSLRKPQEDYQDMIDIIQGVWAWFVQLHRPDLKAPLPDPHRLDWILRQPPGNNLCGYYVCEFLTVYAKRTHLQMQKEIWLKEQVLDMDRLKGIQETIAGFLNEHVLKPGTEFYFNPDEQLKPNQDEHLYDI